MRRVVRGKLFPMGASIVDQDKIQFVFRAFAGKKYGIVIYNKKTEEREIIFLEEEYRIGNFYSVIIEGLKKDMISYTIWEDGLEKADPYGKVIYGNEIWGNTPAEILKTGVYLKEFDWQEDRFPNYSLQEAVFYQLHVRGFTKHASSKVRKKGTFEGIIEKISYLKELGITTLELLPSYEFAEREPNVQAYHSMEDMKETAIYSHHENDVKINYWGFKEGHYFAPKASYSGSKDPSLSFKNLVKQLHLHGLELVMQFYFPLQVSGAMIIEILKFWVEEYHVDGFRLLGVNIPVEIVAGIPQLSNTKILYESIREEAVYGFQQIPCYQNLASYNDGYLYQMRSFLKSDVGSLQQAFRELLDPGNRVGKMVYLTNYNTFTLNDLVSYDRKHNEENGENGTDGNNCNLSWNCGMGGNTRKKQILELRYKQMKNAMTLLLMSRGTPVIMAGDEFSNSQKGNNNPYCQDNLISWLNWKDLERNKEFYEFTRSLIKMRKEENQRKEEKKESGQNSTEKLPSISFHGRDAWKLDWTSSNEEAGGILFVTSESFLYLAINMHWKEAVLALPALEIKGEWKILVDTSGKNDSTVGKKEKLIEVPSRTILILQAERKEKDVKGITAF